FNDCMQKCITAVNVQCKSGMFYYQETSNNCILNTETKATHPDLFNKESQDTVDYFEPNCGGASLATLNTAGASRRLSLLRGFLNKKARKFLRISTIPLIHQSNHHDALVSFQPHLRPRAARKMRTTRFAATMNPPR